MEPELQWTSVGNQSCDDYEANWIVDLWGGEDKEACEKDDPYQTDDRGLWFDGKLE